MTDHGVERVTCAMHRNASRTKNTCPERRSNHSVDRVLRYGFDDRTRHLIRSQTFGVPTDERRQCSTCSFDIAREQGPLDRTCRVSKPVGCRADEGDQTS